MVNEVEDLLLRRLRIAFLCSRDQTLSLVPELSKMLLEEKKLKLSEKDMQEYIKKNI